MNPTIVGSPVVSLANEAPTTYAKGRICSEPTCKTELSVYNSADCCGEHGGWPARRVFGGCGGQGDDLAEIMAESA